MSSELYSGAVDSGKVNYGDLSFYGMGIHGLVEKISKSPENYTDLFAAVSDLESSGPAFKNCHTSFHDYPLDVHQITVQNGASVGMTIQYRSNGHSAPDIIINYAENIKGRVPQPINEQEFYSTLASEGITKEMSMHSLLMAFNKKIEENSNPFGNVSSDLN